MLFKILKQLFPLIVANFAGVIFSLYLFSNYMDTLDEIKMVESSIESVDSQISKLDREISEWNKKRKKFNQYLNDDSISKHKIETFKDLVYFEKEMYRQFDLHSMDFKIKYKNGKKIIDDLAVIEVNLIGKYENPKEIMDIITIIEQNYESKIKRIIYSGGNIEIRFEIVGKKFKI